MESTLNSSDIKQLYDEINSKLKGSSIVVNRLMGLEVLPRVIVQLKKNETTCRECQSSLGQCMVFVENIKDVVNPDNIDLRKQFEDKSTASIKHLRNEHKMVLKGKTFSMILSLLMVIGVFVGGLLSYISQLSVINGVLLGWLVGLVVGYPVGKFRELALKRKHRLY